MKFNHEALSKICFNSKLQKIKNDDLREYWQSFFLVKNILIKITFLLIIGFVVLSTSFGIRQAFINHAPHLIYPNEGISFSFLSNASPAAVYAIQVIPCLLTFGFFIFINKPSIYLGLLIVFFGGLANIIDRALPLDIIAANGKLFPTNAVVDYIPWFSTKCNLPDIYITIGAGLTIIFLIVYLYKTIKEEKTIKKETNKPE